MMETVLSIAGSDPCGGAGIQADIKTMAVIGVYGAAAVTCITAQNSRGVTRVEPLPPELVGEQIEAVLADHRVGHIKIGMVGNGPIAGAIGARLAPFRGEVVIDPVLTSSTGHQLMDAGGMEAYRELLLGRATVLTPNLPELEALTGMTAAGPGVAPQAGKRLLDRYQRLQAVLVKGGHAPEGGAITDYLVYRAKGRCERVDITHPFIESRNSHGTGCTLATAFTAYRSLGADYPEAFRSGVAFVHKCLAAGSGITLVKNPGGSGGLVHHLAFPAR